MTTPETVNPDFLTWVQLNEVDRQKLRNFMLNQGVDLFPIESVVSRENDSEILTRYYFTELALHRLIKNTDFPKVSVPGNLGSSMGAVGIIEATTPEDMTTRRIIIFGRMNGSIELDYNKGRSMLLRETNELLIRTGRAPYPPRV